MLFSSWIVKNKASKRATKARNRFASDRMSMLKECGDSAHLHHVARNA